MSPIVPEHLRVIGVDLNADEGASIGYASSSLSHPGTLTLGANARIRSGTVIYAGTTIGDKLETGHNTIIREGCNIGSDVCLWSNTVVDYGCTIGNRVKIHCNVYIPQQTVIGDDVFIAPGCTFANDLYPGCAQSKKDMRGPVIESWVQIGANVTVLPNVRIGQYSLIGSGSVVTTDIAPRSVAWGNPARVHKQTEDIQCCSGFEDCLYSKLRHSS